MGPDPVRKRLVQVASAKVKLLAPSVPKKIYALRISPVSRSTTGIVWPA